MLSATELAAMLDLSKGRISQLVGEGKLDGCYHGDGRARRFDPEAVAKALGRRTDAGQRLGNGASTQRAIRRIVSGNAPPPPPPSPPVAGPASAPAAPNPESESEYERGRTAKMWAEARRAERQNAEAEGSFVLASEVARQVRRQVGQEIAEVEAYIRDAARVVADRHGLDFKAVRQLMVDRWRAHRGARADAAETAAGSVDLSEAERDADI